MKRLMLLSALLTAISLVSGPLGLAAGEYTNTELKYSISLPDGWSVIDNTGRETYFGRRGADYPGAAVGTLSASTRLTDDRVRHIDLNNLKVTRDTMTRQAGWPARRIDGTAVSEGDALLFYSIAIKPGDDAEIIQLTVWGPPALLSSGAIGQQVDQMLATFRPVR
ncbi:MAG TPA: hypothetical protein VEW91_09590 [bacterium]|nr:hypothetical protein [bacterium]